MAAIITGLIVPQNYEVIRDRIVLILGDELGNQYRLNNNYPNVQKVYAERCLPVNEEKECPLVNVSIAKDEFDNETVLKTIGAVLINIDIVATAETNIDNGPADQYAMITMGKIAGLIRAILSYEGYRTLGFAPGTIQETQVLKYMVLDKSQVADALSGVIGRVQFMVKCIEVSNIIDASVAINEVTTTTQLNGSEFGYFYDYRQQAIQLTATGHVLTNAFFANPINEINLLDSDGNIAATYRLNIDFTQNDTTITSTTFSFTSDTKIIAKT